MAIDGINNSNSLFSTIASGIPAPATRIRRPTVTAEQAEGTFNGKLANGTAISFNISNVEDGRARVRYSSEGVTRSGQVTISANVFRLGDAQLAIGTGGRAQFSRVVNGRVQQTVLQRA